MSTRPRAVAFDVIETLLDLSRLMDRLEEIGQPRELHQRWFLRTQRDAMALGLSGEFQAFQHVARQAMRTESGHTVTEADIDHVLNGFADLPAHPDAEPALSALLDAGVPVGCLTVGNAQTTTQFLETSGLAPYVDTVVTAEDVGIWKPAPQIYHAAAHQLGVPPDRMALVAVHSWDCHGAKHAGCVAGWCSRLEGAYGDVFTPADVQGDDLNTVVTALLDLPTT